MTRVLWCRLVSPDLAPRLSPAEPDRPERRARRASYGCRIWTPSESAHARLASIRAAFRFLFRTEGHPKRGPVCHRVVTGPITAPLKAPRSRLGGVGSRGYVGRGPSGDGRETGRETRTRIGSCARQHRYSVRVRCHAFRVGRAR